MKQLQEFIILSAELDTTTVRSNFYRTELLEFMLQELKLPYKQIQGCYKGSTEQSFMVIVKDEAEYEVIRDFAFKSFNQESILFRDLYGSASLVFQDGTKEQLGKFKQVDNVDNLEAYSVVDGTYWTI